MECSGCKEGRISIEETHFFIMDCDCAIGSPFCNNCHGHFNRLRLGHAQKKGFPLRIACQWCSKSGLIRIRPKSRFLEIFQFWKSLQQIAWRYMHSKILFFRISSDWRVFSRYYRDDFLSLTSHNLETIEMMYSLHQLFFLSQMFRAVDRTTMIHFICNPWRKNLQSQFTLKILRINLARKLVCKFFAFALNSSDYDSLFKQSYLKRCGNFPKRMMHQIIMRLLACHSAIC